MEWKNQPLNLEGNAPRELPEKSGLVHSYPELEPVFEKMGVTATEDKVTMITYFSELFQIAIEYLNSQEDD